MSSYTPQTWTSGDPSTPLSAPRLTHMEGQYAAAMTDTAALYGHDVRAWAPNTVYAAGQAVVNPSGDLVTAKTAHTSGATYTPANWNPSSARKQAIIFANA